MQYTPVPRDLWQQNSERELRFWRGWLSKCAVEYSKAKPLREYLLKFKNEGKLVRLADVGCGAACQTGQADGFEITASDALGDEYQAMWATLGLSPAIPINTQDMTTLTYPDKSFDVVHCRNSLDHCHDPRAALLEFARVCCTGGTVFLNHIPNVARDSHYTGLHRWNITRVRKEDDVRVWSRMPAKAGESGRWSEEVNGFWMSECLPGMYSVRKPFDNGYRVVVEWVK